MSRRKARQAITQILYRNEFHSRIFKKEESPEFFFKCLNKTDQEFALKTLKNLKRHKKKIDAIIKKYAKNWKKERISLVDLNIMRLAICEILFCPDIPDRAALNEALELAKNFAEKKSSVFINGILDQILKNKETELSCREKADV